MFKYIFKIIKEIKRRRERRKLYAGIIKWKEIMDDMQASGKYSDEEMQNIARWWASACVEYAKMF